MTTYRAQAHREGRLWVVDVEGVGVTQGRSLAEAKEMAFDLVVAMRQLAPDDVVVDFAVALPGELAGRLREAREAVKEAESVQRRAAEASRRVVAELRAAGLSGKDTAVVLGVSEQRVSQLSKPVSGRGFAVVA